MAQKSVNEDSKYNELQSQSSQVQATLDRIAAMEAHFQSTKSAFVQNIADLNNMIQTASRQEARKPQITTKPPNMGYARAEADCKEFFDDPKTLNVKIKQLAQLIKKSKHFVAFTGAGISTAAGIADFRSGINTTLDTGGGKWAIQTALKQGKKDEIKKPKRKKKSTFKALPTASHMALVALMTREPKYLKYVISQNTDGLHRRSGTTINQMSELHGNTTLEICTKCKREYMRDYCCRRSARKQSCHNHFTGRYCTVSGCKGTLMDTIVNFNEALPEQTLKLARHNSEKADLFLSLGSSLTVSPASDLPAIVGVKWNAERNTDKDKEPVHNLCIVNLQKTELDYLCSLRIFAKIDDVMIGLMKELQMDINKWFLYRFVKIKLERDEDNELRKKLTVCGVDIDGIHASIFTNAVLRNDGEKIAQERQVVSSEENKFKPDECVFYVANILEKVEERKEDDEDRKNGLVLELSFFKHYNEPNVYIHLNEYLCDLNQTNGWIVIKMQMDPETKMWNVGNKNEQLKDERVKKLWSMYEEKVIENNDNDDNYQGNK